MAFMDKWTRRDRTEKLKKLSEEEMITLVPQNKLLVNLNTTPLISYISYRFLWKSWKVILIDS